MRRARVGALAALVAVAAIVVLLLGRSHGGYLVHVQLANANGLRTGFKVRVDGVPVGKITKVDLGRGDRAIADARIDDSAVPLGRDARATVRAVNILGEKYLDIDRGNVREPAPSGVVVPVSRTGVAIELDDLIDALDLPTRAALNVVLDEAGRGLAGRGSDLAATVAALPSGLDRTGELLRQLSADNRALGRLVDESDRVVGGVAAQHAALGRMVSGAATTLSTLGGRRRQLGQTVRNAPATLAALQRALTALQVAANPLRPAARGLRASAPALTSVLRALPGTAYAAAPALRAARAVAPSLERLATVGAPVARDLRPMARQLAAFSSGVDPTTRAADDAFADVLGVMEGWARTTAPRDAAGHVFRLAVGGGADLIEAMATAGPPAAAPRRPASSRPTPAPALPLPQVHLPALRLPHVPVPAPQVRLPAPAGEVKHLLDYLLGP